MSDRKWTVLASVSLVKTQSALAKVKKKEKRENEKRRERKVVEVVPRWRRRRRGSGSSVASSCWSKVAASHACAGRCDWWTPRPHLPRNNTTAVWAKIRRSRGKRDAFVAHSLPTPHCFCRYKCDAYRCIPAHTRPGG